MSSGYWPNIELVVNKCQAIVDAMQHGQDVTPYLAGNSPSPDGGVMSSSKKRKGSQNRTGASPTRPFNANATGDNFRKQEQPQNFAAMNDSSDQLRNQNQKDDMPQFPPNCKSLLSKFLTRQVWNECKDKTDNEGYTFRQAINSGVQNVDSGIGVYAGSHDSYRQFAPMFDPIIKEYHGHDKADKHVSDMDHTKLKCPPFPPEDAKMIKSTRIRVGRNLADFPLGPGASREQRN